VTVDEILNASASRFDASLAAAFHGGGAFPAMTTAFQGFTNYPFVARITDTAPACAITIAPSSQTIMGCGGALGLSAIAPGLLFPFVTNQVGLDTGASISISYTSKDSFGIAGQLAIGVGTLSSATVPGFQAYMTAVCQFQCAHGFGFISGGSPGWVYVPGVTVTTRPKPGQISGLPTNGPSTEPPQPFTQLVQ
jgi:hypothetical protein